MLKLSTKLLLLRPSLSPIFPLLVRSLISTNDTNGIRKIVLKNPKKRNVLSKDLLASLKINLSENIFDLRCIIISGEGPAFSSGHDLKELTTETGINHHREVFSLCSEVMMCIRGLPIPVIAEVKGVAAAAGCQLVASCDIVVAADTATFSTPGVNFGLFCSMPGIAVARAVPEKIASYMLLTGFLLTAEEALRAGLVSRVVTADKLEGETMNIARAISNKSRSVVELGKKFYYSQIQMDIMAAYREGEKQMVDNLRLKDAQSGIKAFVDKRDAANVWTHTFEKAH